MVIRTTPVTKRIDPKNNLEVTCSRSLRKMALKRTVKKGVVLINGTIVETSPLVRAKKTKNCATAATKAEGTK
jgi:hypothetical protein